MAVSVKVVDHTAQYAKSARVKFELGIKKAAFDIEGYAKDEAPVDTGNMRNGINANGEGLDWRVDSPAEYSIYVHEGRTNVAGRPFLRHALERVRPTLARILKGLM